MKRFGLGIALVLMLLNVAGAHAKSKSFSYLDHSTGMKLTVKKVLLDKSGGSLFKPSPEKAFQLLYVTVTNTGKRAWHFNPLDISLADNRGKRYESTTMLPSEYPQVGLVSVKPGASRSGWVGFEVLKGFKFVQVYWDDQSRLDPPVFIVKINLGKG